MMSRPVRWAMWKISSLAVQIKVRHGKACDDPMRTSKKRSDEMARCENWIHIFKDPYNIICFNIRCASMKLLQQARSGRRAEVVSVKTPHFSTFFWAWSYRGPHVRIPGASVWNVNHLLSVCLGSPGIYIYTYIYIERERERTKYIRSTPFIPKAYQYLYSRLLASSRWTNAQRARTQRTQRPRRRPQGSSGALQIVSWEYLGKIWSQSGIIMNWMMVSMVMYGYICLDLATQQ